MVRIGIVGIGFMGWAHFSGAYKFTAAGRLTGSKLKGAAVTTICSRSPEKLIGDWRSIQGNYGPRGIKLDLTKIVAFDKYDEMFKSPEIDLIDICLPNDQHEEVAIAALNAGKHVIVEKPISLDPKSADRMVAAAKKSGRLLMVAQVLPFVPEYKFVAETIASGKYGKLLAANFRRVISPPKWSSDMSDFHKLGGWGIDLHIHDNHFINLICGKCFREESCRTVSSTMFTLNTFTRTHPLPSVRSAGELPRRGWRFPPDLKSTSNGRLYCKVVVH